MLYFEYFKQFLRLSRLDWSFIFAGLYFMVALFFALHRYDLILGFLACYLLAMGHLSLNGLYDKETDTLNPRSLSLQNPFASNNNLLGAKQVYLWVIFLWGVTLLINLIFLPYMNLEKALLAILFFAICISFSVAYSAPPLRLKGRPILDLLSTFFVFGVCFPIYSVFITAEISFNVNGIIFESYIPPLIILFGILFNVTLLMGMHMPTVLGDLEYDKQAGDVTTAVWLGWKHGSYLTVLASWGRTFMLTVIVTILLIQNVLEITWFVVIPYLLATPDLYYTFKLLKNQDRQSAVNLWKSIIFTSIAGGFSIGYLYFTKNPELLSQYFTLILNNI